MGLLKLKTKKAPVSLVKKFTTAGYEAKRYFDEACLDNMNDYTPMDRGTLIRSAHLQTNRFKDSEVTYNTPYARYQYYGKQMIDPLLGVPGILIHDRGGELRWWSHPGVSKVLTDKDLTYQGAPMRGARWDERMWCDRGAKIKRETANVLKKGFKKG